MSDTAPTRPPVLHRPAHQIGGLMLLALALQSAAAAGMSVLAGPARTVHLLSHARWSWLALTFAALALSLASYYFGYRGVYRVEGGPRLAAARMRAVVVSAFGGFLLQGGAKVDRFVLRAAGSDETEVRVRSVCLSAFELGVLSLIGAGAGMAVLGRGWPPVPGDVSWPWAVAPLPGFVIGFWVAERYRDRRRVRDLLGGWAGSVLDGVHLVAVLFRRPRHLPAVLGMAGFWLAEMLAAWSGLAVFGYHMGAAPFVLGFATGMVITRRAGLLAGAGLLEVALPLSLWYCGAPLPAAVAGTLLYRLVAVWPATGLAAHGLPALRAMVRPHTPLPAATGSGGGPGVGG